MSWALGARFVLAALSVLASAAAAAQEADPPDARKNPEAAPEEKALPHFIFPEAKFKEFADTVNTFHAGGTKEDFDKLEKLYKEFRAAKAPATDGQIWIELFYAVLTEPSKTEDEDWQKHFAKLDDWVKSHPDSWVPLVVAARARIARGWQYRGSGFANTVGPEQWKKFHEQLEIASNLLAKARQLEGHDAAVYEQLIKIGMATSAGRRTMDGFLAAAQKIDPHYYPVYSAMATDLLPRWGGGPGELGGFAEAIWRQNPGGDGPEIYTRIATTVQMYDPMHLLDGEFDLEKLLAGAKVVQARYPRSDRLQNFAALVAWRAQDLDLAKAARGMVQEQYDGYVWKSRKLETEYQRFCELGTKPPPGQRIAWSWQGIVTQLAISPSGKSIVVASYVPLGESPLKLRSLKTLQVTQELEGTGPFPLGLTIDSGGKKLAAWFKPVKIAGKADAPPNAVLYRVGDWDNPTVLESEQVKEFTTLTFSPDGKQLAAGHGAGGIGLWNAETGQVETFLTPKQPLQKRLAFSADGAKLLVAMDRGAEIWELATKKLQHTLPPERPGFASQHALAFGPDGSVIGYGIHADNRQMLTLFRWDPATDQFSDLIKSVPGENPVLSPRGTFVAVPYRPQTAQHSDAVYLWSVARQRRVAKFGGFVDVDPTLRQIVNPPASLAFSPDEKTLVAGCADASVRVWDISSHLPMSE